MLVAIEIIYNYQISWQYEPSVWKYNPLLRIIIDWLYVTVGIVWCVIAHKKTMSPKVNFGKKSSDYKVDTLISVIAICIAIFAYIAGVYAPLEGFFSVISSENFTNVLAVRLVEAMSPSFAFIQLVYMFIAYNITRYFFDKSILQKQ